MSVIEVSNLTKEYRLGAIHGLKQTLLNTGARLIGKQMPERPPFKALHDVSFSIEQGEVVGIIGHNGAGKSTLLKMLAKISTPTSGSVKVNGRIAPLIEVGAGFVPDFTGRENVYLNGSILGMSKKEIDRKFDEIVDFAEMADFIDTPVKRYSSGMQVKLAFAVATSIESEILIVDEVLAVGDLAFQRKCFDRMEQLIRRDGRTVLLVSHNIRQVVRISKRTLMLDHGQLIADGPANEVADLFYTHSDKKIAAFAKKDAQRRESIKYLKDGFDLRSVEVLDDNGEPTNLIPYKSSFSLKICFEATSELRHPVFAIGVDTTDLLHLAVRRSDQDIEMELLLPGKYELVCRVRDFPLLPSVYSLRLGVIDGEFGNERFYGENLAHFHVVADNLRVDYHGECFVQLDASWTILGAPSSTLATNDIP